MYAEAQLNQTDPSHREVHPYMRCNSVEMKAGKTQKMRLTKRHGKYNISDFKQHKI